eukprot:5590189-Lingulodinium_polyedra.AAC.1
MEGPSYCPPSRFCDTCGFCLRADAYDDRVKGKKHRRKIKSDMGHFPPSRTSDAYYWASHVANAELQLLYLR